MAESNTPGINRTLFKTAAEQQSSSFIDNRVQQAVEQASIKLADNPEQSKATVEGVAEQTAALEATRAFQRAVGEIESASQFLKSGQVQPENGKMIVQAARETLLNSLDDIYGPQMYTGHLTAEQRSQDAKDAIHLVAKHDQTGELTSDEKAKVIKAVESGKRAPDLEILETRALIRDRLARSNRPATPEEQAFLADTATLFTEQEEEAAYQSMKAMRDRSLWRNEMPTPEREAARIKSIQEHGEEVLKRRREYAEREQFIANSMNNAINQMQSPSRPMVREEAVVSPQTYNNTSKDQEAVAVNTTNTPGSSQEAAVLHQVEKRKEAAGLHSLQPTEIAGLGHDVLKVGDQVLINPELFMWGINQKGVDACNFFAASTLLLLCRQYPNETTNSLGETQTVERRRRIISDPVDWFNSAVVQLKSELKNLPDGDPQARRLDFKSMRLLLEQRQSTGNLEIVRPETGFNPQEAIALIKEGCLPVLFIEPRSEQARVAGNTERGHAVTALGVSQDNQEIIVFDPLSGEGNPPLRRLPLSEYANRIIVATSARLPAEYSFDSTTHLHFPKKQTLVA